ncbi:MAG: carbohydrate porin [bacterium]
MTETTGKPGWAAYLAAMAVGLAMVAWAGEPVGEPVPEPERPGPSSWLGWQRATGDWGGARSRLEDRGVEVGFGVTTVWQASHRGGIHSHPRGKWSTSWDAELGLDTERLRLWPGGTFFAHWEGSEQVGIDERFVGSMLGVNADAAATGERWSQFSEYWYEQALAGGLLALRLGKQDATNDFDTNAFANDEATQFLNGALVNNPTVPFPDYALGAQAILRPGGGCYLAAGAFDARAEGWTSGRDTALESDSDWFVVAEGGIEGALPLAAADLPGAYRVGAWHDPQRYEDLRTGAERKGESGVYVSLDQMLVREGPESDQGLGLFARYGYAPDRYSEIEHFYSGGVSYRGLIPGRDADVLGLGVAQGKLGPPARSTAPHDNETVYECFYSIVLGAGSALTLDLQYVRHPAADLPSALVPGLRCQVDF